MSSSGFGNAVDALWETIQSRHTADPEKSYTAYLLQSHEDKVLKKIGEESTEVVLAAKDLSAATVLGVGGSSEHGDSLDHLRYETTDLLYHLLVMCARYGLSPDDLAAELKARFSQ